MFVLKEKLINSILIKVKGELCVLYSCLISFPLMSIWDCAASLKSEKRKKKTQWCVLRPLHSPYQPLAFILSQQLVNVWGTGSRGHLATVSRLVGSVGQGPGSLLQLKAW